MAYWEWGDPNNDRVVVCVHGLTRQGRDFDHLARALQSTFRVVCPDVVGRGRSDWLRQPAAYVVPTYVADMVTLLARLNTAQVSWVGTSMGGLIGMALASLPDNPLQRLVLNDVGPQIEPSALERIGTYVGLPQRFDTVEAGADYLRSISTGFGPHSDEDWLALSRPMLVPVDSGCTQWKLHYDPAIGESFRHVSPAFVQQAQAMAWAAYDEIRCPTLLVRGTASDLLTRATAEAMVLRGPRPQVVEWPGVGHAPTLVDPVQVACVAGFLMQDVAA